MSAVKHLKNSNEKSHFLVGRTAPQRFESLSGDPDRRATSTSPQITRQTPSFIGTFNIEKNNDSRHHREHMWNLPQPAASRMVKHSCFRDLHTHQGPHSQHLTFDSPSNDGASLSQVRTRGKRRSARARRTRCVRV